MRWCHALSLTQCASWPRWKWIVCGGISALAWAPFYLWFVLIGTWSALVMGIYHAPHWKQAAKIGGLWSFGWHLCSVFWIGNSLLVVQPWRFAWFWPACLVGIPALFSIYMMVAMAVLRWGKDHVWFSPWAFGIMWCVLYSSFGYLKGILFTGFPWNLVAYIWGNTLCVAQSASFASSYGLGIMTLFLLSWPIRKYLIKPTVQMLGRGTLYAGLGLVCLSTYSAVRLHHFPTEYIKGPVLRLVQPNFSQKIKQDQQATELNWNTLMHLSEAPGPQSVTHVIWPETAFPFYMADHQFAHIMPLIHAGFPVHLITGAMVAFKNESFNSIVYVSPNKEGARPVYHKQHLVPFGEYLPLKRFLKMVFPLKWLRWLSPFTRDMSEATQDMSEADGMCVHCIPGLPPSVMRICYEIVFPVSYPRVCADWILNLTNDAWFGYSPGPFQHLASTQFRAIEEGIPAVRVANTGVSAVFDGLGRVCGYIPLETRGYLDIQLPKPIPVSYRFLHEWVYFGLLLSGLFLSVGHGYRRTILRGRRSINESD